MNGSILTLSVIVCGLFGCTMMITAQPTWKYVETPNGCGFQECAWNATGTLFCVSDTCGGWRYQLSTNAFEPLNFRGTTSIKVVPRSVDIDINGTIHVVGVEVDTTKQYNLRTTPFYCTSTDGGDTWQYHVPADHTYGTYKVVRCMMDGAVIIAAEVLYPASGFISRMDSISVYVMRVTDSGVRQSILSQSSHRSPNGVYCPRGGDYFTITLTTDGYKGVGETDAAPCQYWDDPGSALYSRRRWNSFDGGESFPESIYPSLPHHYIYYRPGDYSDRNYLAPDYWIFYDEVTRDQGKTKFIDERARSDGSGTLIINEYLPALVGDRIAIGLTADPSANDSIVSYVVGSFSLDGGDFIVEHKQSVIARSVNPGRGNKRGYAVIPIEPQGLFIRIPDSSTTVVDPPRESLRIYPNPGEDMVTVTGLTSDQEVMVMTMQGRLVHTAKSYGYSVSLDLSALAVGSYLVRTSDGGSQQLLQVIR